MMVKDGWEALFYISPRPLAWEDQNYHDNQG